MHVCLHLFCDYVQYFQCCEKKYFNVFNCICNLCFWMNICSSNRGIPENVHSQFPGHLSQNAHMMRQSHVEVQTLILFPGNRWMQSLWLYTSASTHFTKCVQMYKRKLRCDCSLYESLLLLISYLFWGNLNLNNHVIFQHVGAFSRGEHHKLSDGRPGDEAYSQFQVILSKPSWCWS